MTDSEIVLALAERVMGWEIYNDETDWRVHCLERRGHATNACCIKEDGTVLIALPSFGIHRWRPLDSMDDAMLITSKLEEEHWDYQVGSCVEGHAALFERGVYDPYADTRDEMWEAIASTPQRAICLAALCCVGVEV